MLVNTAMFSVAGILERCEKVCPKDQLPRTAASAAGIHATFALDHTVLWILTIYLWWVLWISRCRTRRELKGIIRLASAKGRGLFLFVWKALT